MANYNHACYYLTIFYFLLLLLPIIPTASDDDNSLSSSCRGSLVPTVNLTDFLRARNHLLLDIANNASNKYVYDDNTINGLSLCRGDISADECMTCLTNVTSEMSKTKCTMDTSIDFHDHCLVKYSSTDFFEKIDTDNVYDACDGVDMEGFPAGSASFLDGLIGVANVSVNMFASANTTDGYRGLVQCTMDLDEDNCTACLQRGKDYLLSDCSKSLGGKYYSGSCIAIYHKSE